MTYKVSSGTLSLYLLTVLGKMDLDRSSSVQSKTKQDRFWTCTISNNYVFVLLLFVYITALCICNYALMCVAD